MKKLFDEISCCVEKGDGTCRDYVVDYIHEELKTPKAEIIAAIDKMVAKKLLIEAHPDSIYHGGLYNPKYTPNTAQEVQEENERILAREHNAHL